MLSARKIVGPEANSAIALHRLMRLVHVRIGLGRLGQAVVDLGAQVAGRAGVELLLGHAALLVVANDLELVHVVGLLGKEGLHLVLEHPPAGLPDVLVHGGARRADHPAVAVAMADLRADPLRLVGVPELVPRLVIEVAHDLLVLGAVAGHDVAVGIDKEGVERHVAGQQARLAVDVVDEAVVEVGAEPLLGAVGPEQLVDQVLEVLGHHGAVVDDVLGLDEVEAVVQRSRGELHAQLIGDLVEGHQVGRVEVLHRHAEAHVGVLELDELLKGGVASVVSVIQAADLVVGLLQALDGDADADVGELLTQVDDAVGEEAVGGDYDAVGLLVELAHDVLEVLADEGLAAGDVGEVHLGELLDGLDGELLLRAAGSLVAVAHGAARVAAVGDDDGTVEFLFGHELTIPSGLDITGRIYEKIERAQTFHSQHRENRADEAGSQTDYHVNSRRGNANLHKHNANSGGKDGVHEEYGHSPFRNCRKNVGLRTSARPRDAR